MNGVQPVVPAVFDLTSVGENLAALPWRGVLIGALVSLVLSVLVLVAVTVWEDMQAARADRAAAEQEAAPAPAPVEQLDAMAELTRRLHEQAATPEQLERVRAFEAKLAAAQERARVDGWRQP